jgi:GT2 family glycosyltransferase/glycosyltransferase involved in cell wall biosynthesis
MEEIDIIIPIYGDFEKTKDCLSSVLRQQDAVQRIILINDMSPDKKITEFLREIKKKHPKTILIEHEENLGFVKTVNEGMSLSKKNDVILLNSDTVVTKNWVKKIVNTAKLAPKVATVTPFSNSATIFSYPNYLENNELINGLNPEEINSFFEQASKNELIEVPTGHGFCMYVSRKSIQKIGFFDEKTFGTGYGEENDFCVRASKAGFKNIACTNTFIYHADGASFADSKKEKTEKAMKLLLSKHPDYTKKVADFISKDPFTKLRIKADYIRLAKSGRPGVLFIQHDLGGGVEKHVIALTNEAKENNWNPIIIEPNPDGIILYLEKKKEKKKIVFKGSGWYKNLLEILLPLNIQVVHFHHLIHLPEEILNISDDLNAKKYFTIHDYYLVCPRIFFLKEDMAFCGATLDSAECDNCIEVEGGISRWRERSSLFLRSCDLVFAPSKSATEYVNKYFEGIKIDIVPHKYLGYINNEKYSDHMLDSDIKVAFIGTIVPHQGSRIIAECLAYTKKNKLPIKWFVFGEYPDNKDQKIFVSGRYEGFDALSELIVNNKIDVICLPSLAPETFSFALSEAWSLGIPVISSNLGAIGERIKKVEAGWALDYPLKAESVCELATSIKNSPKEYKEKIKAIKNYSQEIFLWDKYYKPTSPKKTTSKKEFLKQLSIIDSIYLDEGDKLYYEKILERGWYFLDKKPLVVIKNALRKLGISEYLKIKVKGKKL